MAKRPEGYWKQWYRDHREERIAQTTEYAERHRTERKAYLAAYYKKNKPKYKLSPERKRKKNKKRKGRYGRDRVYRELQKIAAREWWAAHPRKRLDQRLRKYGITADDYDRILAEQSSGCGICGRADSGDSRGYRFHVDHCHSTNNVRGLLCANCNMGIGKFGDDPERFERAAVYLRAHIRPTTANQ